MTTKKLNVIVKFVLPILIAVIALLFAFLFVTVSGLEGGGTLYIPLAVTGAVVLLALLAYILLCRWARKKILWYDEILDSLPWPLSITDNNRKWTFINKAVEGMLGVKRDDMMGKPCSSWGAGICGTGNCGINCLERGESTTTFEQGGMDFKVDIAFLVDEKERKIGHIEVVQDISQLVKKQKAEERLVQEISAVSSSFIAGSKQIADGAQSLAQGSTEQAATTEQLAASVSEIADRTRSNSEMAAEAAALAESIKANAEKGSRQMGEMVAAVNDITVASESIGKVIKAIDDIAFQTNILALNAAVEAARAGQHGKGFAVVADEVRSLAAKSAEAAKDTGVLITNSIDKARLGGQIANETAGSLSEIVTGINESSAVVSNIADFSEEQTAGIDQVREAIEQIAQVVQVNSATTEESAAAAELLNTHAITLAKLLDTFRRENEE